MDAFIACLPLLIGWTLDLIFGDPSRLPHPIVWFGKAISFCDKSFNRGKLRTIKGATCSLFLILGTYIAAHVTLDLIKNELANILVQGIAIFFCLSGTTLIREVKGVFIALDQGLEEGRKQVGRIVGRDISHLTRDEVKTAALETLAENLSDGVVAPLFWYALLGVPGMLAYKMVNTLDSMIGYRNERFKQFGCAAAKIDDIANYIPARITSALMLLSKGKLNCYSFVKENGRKHLSPNSGYPEAALAGILNCRFGGPHYYFGEMVYKPYIGSNEKPLTNVDMQIALAINRRVECLCVTIILAVKSIACLF